MHKEVQPTAPVARDGTLYDARRLLERFRAELTSARTSLPIIATLDDDVRRRVLAEMRTALPDAASRVARLVGAASVLAELLRASGTQPKDTWCVEEWRAVVALCEEAALAGG